ncbi:uncharacterized protein PHALS_07452 [Plasmopara halstedii]|uniref:Uncharacterized protein n=1 Tax=Plasmopara halstedii TaxID=4781 RepID=A0A0P1B6I7_PLAHL|nr:uncharacterized protein PHALS_07452 [Plasmopara halstedii]CEG49700.1 hypothetical protein PHALS_07452 [Plasmopara halstedii]|eukprot:XP_024586069.1 hypothetical protein PHALS_07452 [Plasmopara halstedii]
MGLSFDKPAAKIQEAAAVGKHTKSRYNTFNNPASTEADKMRHVEDFIDKTRMHFKPMHIRPFGIKMGLRRPEQAFIHRSRRRGAAPHSPDEQKLMQKTIFPVAISRQ